MDHDGNNAHQHQIHQEQYYLEDDELNFKEPNELPLEYAASVADEDDDRQNEECEYQENGIEMDTESGLENDYCEWVFDGNLEDTLLDLTTEQAMATLRYFTSTADRTNIMTKTHSDDLELISQLLSEKEKDLEMAARIGQSLLQRNKDLLLKIERMEDYLSETKDNEEQLKYDLKHKNALVRQYIEDDENRSLYSSGSNNECDDEELMKLTRRCRMLEKENQDLFSEALQIREITEEAENAEEGLVLDCIEQLSSAKEQITSLTDEIAQKFEDNVRQQEEITQLISMVLELQNKHKELNIENEQLQTQLYEAKENQETLKDQLATMQEKFRETMGLLQENQEEMRMLKSRIDPSSRMPPEWSMEVTPPSSSFLQDSLANEIEESVKRDLYAREDFLESRRYNKKVLDNVRYLNIRQAESRSTSGRTSPVSNWSLASDERSDTNSTMSYDTEPAKTKKPAKKLQIVKPLEGSDTLHKWHHLALQNVKGGLTISNKKEDEKTPEETPVSIIDTPSSIPPDIAEDDVADEEQQTRKFKPIPAPRVIKQSTPDEKSTIFSDFNTPVRTKKTILTRNSSALTSLRQGRKLLTDKEREGKSNVEVIDMIASAMSKVNLEAKTGQRILMSLAKNPKRIARQSTAAHVYKNMPHVTKAFEKVQNDDKNQSNEQKQDFKAADAVKDSAELATKKIENNDLTDIAYKSENKVNDRIGSSISANILEKITPLVEHQKKEENAGFNLDNEETDQFTDTEYLHLDDNDKPSVANEIDEPLNSVVNSQPSIDNEIDEDLNSVSGPLGLLNRANPTDSNEEIKNRLLRLSNKNEIDAAGINDKSKSIRRNQSSGSLVELVMNKRTRPRLAHLISPPVSSRSSIAGDLDIAGNVGNSEVNIENNVTPKESSKSVGSGLDNQNTEPPPNKQGGGLFGLLSFFS